MGSFVTVEHEEVEHKIHSCKLSTEQILVTNRADMNLKMCRLQLGFWRAIICLKYIEFLNDWVSNKTICVFLKWQKSTALVCFMLLHLNSCLELLGRLWSRTIDSLTLGWMEFSMDFSCSIATSSHCSEQHSHCCKDFTASLSRETMLCRGQGTR